MPPNSIHHKTADKSYRAAPYNCNLVYLAKADLDVCRIGPCDITSKHEIGQLVHKIAKQEKYINLLSMFKICGKAPSDWSPGLTE